MLTANANALRFSFVSFVLLLAGCGGVGAGGALPSSQPAAREATRAAAATPNPWPSGGASLVYSGTFRQTGIGGSGATQSVNERITIKSATYAGRPVTDYHGVELVGTPPATATFDAYVAQTPSRVRIGSDVRLLKAVSQSAGVTQTTVYGAGNGLFDRVPEIPEARWSNAATRVVSIENASASSSLVDRYRADGSYDENATPVEGRVALLQSYGDGSALYQWPYAAASANSSITFPAPTKSLIKFFITNVALHFTESGELTTWYSSVPPLLASDTFVDEGRVAIPSTCGAAKRFGSTATEIAERTTRTDVVFGEYEATTRDAYVEAPYGLVCLSVRDELRTYYSYATLAFSDKPLTDVVSTETLGLQQARLPKHAAALTAAGSALPLDSRVVLWGASRRLSTARAIFHSLRLVRKP